MPTPSRQFLFFCLSFISGIGLAGLLPASTAGGHEPVISQGLWWFGISVFALVLAIVFWPTVKVRLICLTAFFLFLGFWRYGLALPEVGFEQISYFNNRQVEVFGMVVSEPDERVDQIRYEVGEISIQSRQLRGKLLLVNRLTPAFSYGDRIKFNCKLKAPRDFDDFNYNRYLARYDLYSLCYFPEVVLTKTADWQGIAENFFGRIYRLKISLRSLINRGLPEPEASLANGMTLGDQKSLPADLRADFSRTGLSHLIAISGMNITIIMVGLAAVLVALGWRRDQTFYLIGTIITVYIILIGAPASAVRAGAMSGLLLFAARFGRLSKIINLLVLAAAAMLIFEPRLLRDDLGFVLSFTALLSLVYFFQPLDDWFSGFTPSRLKIFRQAVSLTLAAQVLTWPIMAYNFSQISLVAPLANLAVIWTLPILTAAVFLILPLAGLLPPAANFLFLPARIILKYILSVVHYLGGWQFAAISLDFKYPLLIIIYYGLIAWYLASRSRIKTRQG